MKDVYVEWLVSKERSAMDKFVRGLCVVALVICILLFALTGNMLLFLVAVGIGLFTYFAYTYTDVEYEYVYLTGEFSIDRILAKSKRKRIEKFDTDHIEIIAPVNSYRLGGHASKKYREYDYSTGRKKENSHLFVMYCDGKKVIFEPNRDLIVALKDSLPHKVFMD